MTELQHPQAVAALGEMLGEITTKHREQVEVNKLALGHHTS